MSLKLTRELEKQVAPDGQPYNTVVLRNSNGMTMTLIDIGATWVSCVLPIEGELSDGREVLLGCIDYGAQPSYLGATVGRYANRIYQGRFTIGDDVFQVTTNQAGNALHGGVEGFDKRRWSLIEHTPQVATYRLVSYDGYQGFPGELTVEVRYELTDSNEVAIGYTAKTDKPTLVNLTNHAYFNLMGADDGKDCLSHSLSINADHFLPTDAVGIPVASLMEVANTSFDFRQSQRIDAKWLADEHQQAAKGYDHSFLLNINCLQGAIAAQAIAPDGSVKLNVYTDKPAMQLYTGNYLAGTPNRIGGEYSDYSGFALETQFLPDSPNHPEWPQPSCVLQPDQVYQSMTRYCFDISGETSGS